MARCKECHSVITRNDSECYICGVPVLKKPFWIRRENEAVPVITPMSNVLFVISLALTLFSLCAPSKIPVSAGATLSGILFVARIVSDRIAQKQRLALRPVTVTRLDY
jgi:hypothetical protein